VCVGGEDEDVGRRGRRSGVVAIPRCHVVVWVGCGGRWARRKGLRLVASITMSSVSLLVGLGGSIRRMYAVGVSVVSLFQLKGGSWLKGQFVIGINSWRTL